MKSQSSLNSLQLVLCCCLTMVFATPALADLAVLVDQGTLVLTNPQAAGNQNDENDEDPVISPETGEPIDDGSDPISASYVGIGGWGVTGNSFVDVAAMSFDFGDTTSVTAATLRLPIREVFPQNGTANVRISFFADDGQIAFDDFSIGFTEPLSEIDAASLTEISIDVTGAVNAALQTSRFVGFRVRSAVEPGNVQTDLFPAFTGVRLTLNPLLEFVPGPAPTLPADGTRFDGYTLQVPTIDAAGIGEVAATLNLIDPNELIFQLTSAQVTNTQGPSAPSRSGAELLNCEAFSPPAAAEVAEGVASYSNSSGILDIPSVNLYGDQVAVRLELIEGSEPPQFETLFITAVQTGTQGANISALGGGILVEPTQDFLPLCHGWVLISDFTRNRAVERNLLSGETGRVVQMNTAPDQFVLDEERNVVHMNAYPESARIYSLDLVTGEFEFDPIRLTFEGSDSVTYTYNWALRDLALGEDGNLFAIMYDGAGTDPLNDIPFSDTQLWFGHFDPEGNFLFAFAAEEPRRVEYDPVRNHLFATTESNLATFDYNPATAEISIVDGTDIAVGTACTDFAVSPQGNRLAYVCPRGNYPVEEFSVVDMDPRAYFNNDGEWFFGSSPISATFNNDGTLFLGADNDRIYLFDVKTHLILEDFELGLLEGESVSMVRFSRDGNFIYLLIENERYADNSKFYWMPTPNIQGSPL